MLIKKGQKLLIKHKRTGTFYALAMRDFDTKNESFWPVTACEQVHGLNTYWVPGEEIPCRQSLVLSFIPVK